MKIKALIIILFIPAILIADYYTINPAVGFIASVNDARARAMGRTELMSSTGPNAMFANPANLINVIYPSAQMSGREMSGTINDGDWTSVSSDFWKGSYPSNSKFSQIAFAMPFSVPRINKKAVAAIGYETYLDWRLNFDEQFQATNSGVTELMDNTLTGGLNTISIAGVLKLNERFDLGIAFYKSYNSDLRITNVRAFDPDPGPLPIWYQRIMEYDVSAYFAVIGVNANLPGNIAAGLIVKPHFTVKLECKLNTLDSNLDHFDEKFRLGDVYGLGFSKKFLNLFRIATEYQNRPYSVLYFHTDNQIIGKTKNGHCFRIGLETQTIIPIRLGYFIESLPIGEQNPEKSAPKSLSGFTAGIGLITRYFHIDTFAEFSSWSYDHFVYGYEPPAVYERQESLTSFGATITVQIPWK